MAAATADGNEYVKGGDFGKTGMETASAVGGAWYPSHVLTHQAGCTFISTLTMQEETTVKVTPPPQKHPQIKCVSFLSVSIYFTVIFSTAHQSWSQLT